MLILPRSVWTTRTVGWSYPLRAADVHTMAIHWPGTPVRTYRLDEKSIGKVIAGFEAYHVGTRGWPGIGYCYLVDWQGRVYTGAGDRKAAHSATSSYPTANAEIIGVQLILGTEDEVTPAMIAAVRDLYAEKRRTFPRLSKIIGHRDVRGASTTCPGPRAHALVKSLAFFPQAGRYPAEYVREVQDLLNLTLAAGLVRDGLLGPLTTAAIEAFQVTHGLRVDGDPGPLTLAALRAAAGQTPPEEDDMPTPQEIAAAVWDHPVTIALPDGTEQTEKAGVWLAWGNRHALAASRITPEVTVELADVPEGVAASVRDALRGLTLTIGEV